jgi:hypothetical protein
MHDDSHPDDVFVVQSSTVSGRGSICGDSRTSVVSAGLVLDSRHSPPSRSSDHRTVQHHENIPHIKTQRKNVSVVMYTVQLIYYHFHSCFFFFFFFTLAIKEDNKTLGESTSKCSVYYQNLCQITS